MCDIIEGMFKKFFLIVLFLNALQAEIFEIDNIDDIRPYATDSSGLVLLDIDDTLIAPPFVLGRSGWRVWAKDLLSDIDASFNVYESLALYIAVKVPYIAVDEAAIKLVADLQAREIPTFAFTARGRTFWYNIHLVGMDRFTEQQLHQAGYDLSKSRIPHGLRFPEAFFYNGIIFTEYKVKKGDFFIKLFKNQSYLPSYIVFVDDKLDQVKSVEKAAKELNIPFYGFWYKASDNESLKLNPMIGNIELEELLLNHTIVTDMQAREKLQELEEGDPVDYLETIMDSIDLNILAPKVPYQHDRP